MVEYERRLPGDRRLYASGGPLESSRLGSILAKYLISIQRNLYVHVCVHHGQCLAQYSWAGLGFGALRLSPGLQ